MPSTTVRASENGRPCRPVRDGRNGAISAHWSSERSWKRDTPPASRLYPSPFTRHALAVVPTEVGYAAGWWVALQRGVAAVMIIGVEEGGELCEALGFAGVGARVGPFLFQGAVEPLDLAVG